MYKCIKERIFYLFIATFSAGALSAALVESGLLRSDPGGLFIRGYEKWNSLMDNKESALFSFLCFVKMFFALNELQRGTNILEDQHKIPHRISTQPYTLRKERKVRHELFCSLTWPIMNLQIEWVRTDSVSTNWPSWRAHTHTHTLIDFNIL